MKGSKASRGDHHLRSSALHPIRFPHPTSPWFFCFDPAEGRMVFSSQFFGVKYHLYPPWNRRWLKTGYTNKQA